MAFNRELAERVLAHIESLPTEGPGDMWRQNVWIRKTECGTVACFAGWTVKLANPSGLLTDWPSIGRQAATLLGLDDDDDDYFDAVGVGHLFYADNSLEDISEVIKRLAERDGV